MTEADAQRNQLGDAINPVKEGRPVYLSEKGGSLTEKSISVDDEEAVAAVTERDLNHKKKQVRRNTNSTSSHELILLCSGVSWLGPSLVDLPVNRCDLW